MSHDEASELLAAAALDALAADEQSAVLAHAATCATCGPELEALRQALAALGNSAPPPSKPATPDVERRLQRIRMRLLARAEADRAPLQMPARRRNIAPWLAAAAALLIAVLLFSQQRSTSAALAQANQKAVAATAAVDTLQAKIAQDQREIHDLTGPNTSVVNMSTSGAAEATAMMFWDKTNNTWSFYAHRMPPVPAGKTYQIWLLTPTEKISAGTFTPAPDSSVEVHATYALPHDALRGVAVSEEPAGGVPQPTGRIVILGSPGPK
ncbi:MAG TPA: anti-sigma factor [Gemmatimonadaceae bacterium]|nr:anti-sigma factor [Gemmatimonadaceae bacterium]